jgi:hypothetical protein
MNNLNLVYPMIAMVALSFVVFVSLFYTRVQGIKNKQVSAFYYKLYQGQEANQKAVNLARNFSNLFETPTLFYIACLVAMQGSQVTMPFYICAWLYAGLRVQHTYIHVGKNKIMPRMTVYLISWSLLMAMLLQLLPALSN